MADEFEHPPRQGRGEEGDGEDDYEPLGDNKLEEIVAGREDTAEEVGGEQEHEDAPRYQEHNEKLPDYAHQGYVPVTCGTDTFYFPECDHQNDIPRHIESYADQCNDSCFWNEDSHRTYAVDGLCTYCRVPGFKGLGTFSNMARFSRADPDHPVNVVNEESARVDRLSWEAETDTALRNLGEARNYLEAGVKQTKRYEVPNCREQRLRRHNVRRLERRVHLAKQAVRQIQSWQKRQRVAMKSRIYFYTLPYIQDKGNAASSLGSFAKPVSLKDLMASTQQVCRFCNEKLVGNGTQDKTAVRLPCSHIVHQQCLNDSEAEYEVPFCPICQEGYDAVLFLRSLDLNEPDFNSGDESSVLSDSDEDVENVDTSQEAAEHMKREVLDAQKQLAITVRNYEAEMAEAKRLVEDFEDETRTLLEEQDKLISHLPFDQMRRYRQGLPPDPDISARTHVELQRLRDDYAALGLESRRQQEQLQQYRNQIQTINHDKEALRGEISEHKKALVAKEKDKKSEVIAISKKCRSILKQQTKDAEKTQLELRAQLRNARAELVMVQDEYSVLKDSVQKSLDARSGDIAEAGYAKSPGPAYRRSPPQGQTSSGSSRSSRVIPRTRPVQRFSIERSPQHDPGSGRDVQRPEGFWTEEKERVAGSVMLFLVVVLLVVVFVLVKRGK